MQDSLVEFSFLPLPGQSLCLQGLPGSESWPEIERDAEAFLATVVTFEWCHDAGAVIPHIQATYRGSLKHAFESHAPQVFENNRLLYLTSRDLEG